MNRLQPPVPPAVATLRREVRQPHCPMTTMARAAEVAHQPVPTHVSRGLSDE